MASLTSTIKQIAQKTVAIVNTANKVNPTKPTATKSGGVTIKIDPGLTITTPGTPSSPGTKITYREEEPPPEPKAPPTTTGRGGGGGRGGHRQAPAPVPIIEPTVPTPGPSAPAKSAPLPSAPLPSVDKQIDKGLNGGTKPSSGGGYKLPTSPPPSMTGKVTPIPSLQKALPSTTPTQVSMDIGKTQDPLRGWIPVYQEGKMLGFTKGEKFIPAEAAVDKATGNYRPGDVTRTEVSSNVNDKSTTEVYKTVSGGNYVVTTTTGELGRNVDYSLKQDGNVYTFKSTLPTVGKDYNEIFRRTAQSYISQLPASATSADVDAAIKKAQDWTSITATQQGVALNWEAPTPEIMGPTLPEGYTPTAYVPPIKPSYLPVWIKEPLEHVVFPLGDVLGTIQERATKVAAKGIWDIGMGLGTVQEKAVKGIGQAWLTGTQRQIAPYAIAGGLVVKGVEKAAPAVWDVAMGLGTFQEKAIQGVGQAWWTGTQRQIAPYAIAGGLVVKGVEKAAPVVWDVTQRLGTIQENIFKEGWAHVIEPASRLQDVVIQKVGQTGLALGTLQEKAVKGTWNVAMGLGTLQEKAVKGTWDVAMGLGTLQEKAVKGVWDVGMELGTLQEKAVQGVGQAWWRETKRQATPYVIAGSLAVKGVEKAAPVVWDVAMGLGTLQEKAVQGVGQAWWRETKRQATPYVIAGGLAVKGVEKAAPVVWDITQRLGTAQENIFNIATLPIQTINYGLEKSGKIGWDIGMGLGTIQEKSPQIAKLSAKGIWDVGMGLGTLQEKAVKGIWDVGMGLGTLQEKATKVGIGLAVVPSEAINYLFKPISDPKKEFEKVKTLLEFGASSEGTTGRTEFRAQHTFKEKLGSIDAWTVPIAGAMFLSEGLKKVKEGASAGYGWLTTTSFWQGKPDYYITPEGDKIYASDLKGKQPPVGSIGYRPEAQDIFGRTKGLAPERIAWSGEEKATVRDTVAKKSKDVISTAEWFIPGAKFITTAEYLPEITATVLTKGPKKAWQEKGFEAVALGTQWAAPLLKWGTKTEKVQEFKGFYAIQGTDKTKGTVFKFIKYASPADIPKGLPGYKAYTTKTIDTVQYVIPNLVKDYMIASSTPVGQGLNKKASAAMRETVAKEVALRYLKPEVKAYQKEIQDQFDRQYKGGIIAGDITYEKALKEYMSGNEYQQLIKQVEREATKNPSVTSGLRIIGLKLADFFTPESPGQVLAAGAVAATLIQPAGLLKVTGAIQKTAYGRVAFTGLEGYTAVTESRKAFNPLLPIESRITGAFFGTLGAIGFATDIKQAINLLNRKGKGLFTSNLFSSNIEGKGTATGKRIGAGEPIQLSDISDIKEGRTLIMTKSGKIKDIAKSGMSPSMEQAKGFMNYGLADDGSVQIGYLQSYQEKGSGVGTKLVKYLQGKYPDKYMAALSTKDASGFYDKTGWQLVKTKNYADLKGGSLDFWQKMPTGLTSVQEEKLVLKELNKLSSAYGNRVSVEVYYKDKLIMGLDRNANTLDLPGGGIEFAKKPVYDKVKDVFYGGQLKNPRVQGIQELKEEFGYLKKVDGKLKLVVPKRILPKPEDLEYVGFFGGHRNNVVYRLTLTDEQYKLIKPSSDLKSIKLVNPGDVTPGTQSFLFPLQRAPQNLKEWASWAITPGGGLYGTDTAQIVSKFRELPKVQAQISQMTANEKVGLLKESQAWIAKTYGKQFVNTYPGEKAIEEYLLAQKGVAGAQISSFGPFTDYFESAAGRTTFVTRVPKGQPGAGEFKSFATKTVTFTNVPKEVSPTGKVKLWQGPVIWGPGSEYKFGKSVALEYVQGTQEMIGHGARGLPKTDIPLVGKSFTVNKPLYFQPPLYPKGPYFVGLSYLGYGKVDPESFTIIKNAPAYLMSYAKSPTSIKPSSEVAALSTTKKSTGQELEYIYPPGTKMFYLDKGFNAPIGFETAKLKYGIAYAGKAPVLTPLQKAEQAFFAAENSLAKGFAFLQPMESVSVAKTYISPFILASEASLLPSFKTTSSSYTPRRPSRLPVSSIRLSVSETTAAPSEPSVGGFEGGSGGGGDDGGGGGGDDGGGGEDGGGGSTPPGPSTSFVPSSGRAPPSDYFFPELLPRKKTTKKKIIRKGIGYEVFVKKRGRYQPAMLPYSLPKEEAIAIGARQVLGTARATFKIVPSLRPLRITGARVSPQMIQTFFRPPKSKQAGVFVQRQALRITSPGEKSEITRLGISTRLAKQYEDRMFGRPRTTSNRGLSILRLKSQNNRRAKFVY